MYIPSQFTIEDDDLDLLWRFTAYIEKVIIHARIDYLRRSDRHKREIPLDCLMQEQEPSNDGFSPPSSNEFAFEEDRLENAFTSLNLLRQRILTLIFVEGFSAQETADRLNCSVDYVYLQKHRALKALRDQLMEEGEMYGE